MAARFLNGEMLRDREGHTICPLEALKEVLLVDGDGWHSTVVAADSKPNLTSVTSQPRTGGPPPLARVGWADTRPPIVIPFCRRHNVGA